MKYKKIVSIVLSACLALCINVKPVFAIDDNGKIDLYEAFSSNQDKMKTEVGSRIYKWSMHLPDDGTIYKSEQANYFNMSTSSYQSNIQLEVDKNRDNVTLEELLYKMQNRPNNRYFYYGDDKEYVMDIRSDESGQKYIHIIKANQMYDSYMVNEAAQEFSDYIENRIYVSNNYIYNLTITMKGAFYREHEEMFNKLSSSFKLSFDNNNPYIKELSDSVSTTRDYSNSSYGWKITLSPYWRVNGVPNARTQYFVPVYSDDELNMSYKPEANIEGEYDVQEGLVVTLLGSVNSNETAASFGEKELTNFKNNYNSKVYEILDYGKKTQSNLDTYHSVIRYKTITGKPYVVHNLYVVGNGYKYTVSATMKDEKYADAKKRADFENMLNSFSLSKNNLSKYLGKIVLAESLIDVNSSKDFKMKKYDFTTKLTKTWNTSDNDFYYGSNYYKGMSESYQPGWDYRANITNNEFINATEAASNINISMVAGLNAGDMNELINNRAESLSKDDEVRMGLAKITIKSCQYGNAEIYYISKEYDLNSVLSFVQSDKTKTYDFEKLQNQYDYIVKVGNNTYTQSISLPLAMTTEINKAKVNKIWSDTSICGTNYSKYDLSWKLHTLEEFNADK